MEKTFEQLKWEMEIIDEFIEKAYEGLIIIDQEGKIIKFKYEKFLDVKENEVIGKHVTEVVENTRLHIVLETGLAEIGDIQQIKGHRVVTSRIPIIREGVVVGAVGTILFKDVSEVKHMAEHLEQMRKYVAKYKQEIKRMHTSKYSFDQILTNDPQMKKVIHLARKAAQTNSSIYIEGASGTGKEYLAHAIHEASNRRYGPFVSINCASIPATLFESEIFGYEAGAFTGAASHGKMGKFEIANGGTIFLDEISSIPLEMQVKLLRVIEEREIDRVGGNERIPIDVRFVAASNESLVKCIAEGRFRSDLYYRLNVVEINLPTLVQRKRDVHLLMHHFLDLYSSQSAWQPNGFSKEAKMCLEAYEWPGNIRELRNVIERAVTITESKNIGVKSLPEHIRQLGGKTEIHLSIEGVELIEQGGLKEQLEFVEKQLILKTLEACEGSKTEAAKHLGIHRTALYKKMSKFNLLDVEIK